LSSEKSEARCSASSKKRSMVGAVDIVCSLTKFGVVVCTRRLGFTDDLVLPII
jgi:hypothetical protein